MDKNNIYLRFNPFSEIVAVPFLLHRIFKGQKIKELLNEKIEYARDQASRAKFTDVEKFEKKLEYQNLDNFFANHFRLLDNSFAHTFEDKIKYCLAQYYKESRNLYTSTNLVVLEENFLKGTEKTLFLYFILLKEDEKVSKIIEPKNETILNDVITAKIRLVNENVSKIENSILLKETFVNQQLFHEIDFMKLKEINLIYDANLSGFQLRNRFKGDLILFILLLEQHKIIVIPSDKYVVGIIDEIFAVKISETNFTIYKNVIRDYEKSGKISKENRSAIQNINIFINKYMP